MSKPIRLRLSRSKGFNLQALSRATNGLRAVNVSRPSKWGNPYHIGQCGFVNVRPDEVVAEMMPGGVLTRLSVRGRGRPGLPITPFPRALTREDVISLYRAHLADNGLLHRVREELRGANLACWCDAGDACHADVLLEIANGGADG